MRLKYLIETKSSAKMVSDVLDICSHSRDCPLGTRLKNYDLVETQTIISKHLG